MKDPRAAAIIAALVRDAVRPMPRTKLVKLVYLLDEQWFWLHGETATGLDYIYDNHGPNARGNAIVKIADGLAGSDVTIDRRTTSLGTDWIAYSVGPDPRVDQITPELTSAIGDILSRFGTLSVEKVVAASKATRPFESNPRPGMALSFATAKDRSRQRLGDIESAVRERRSRASMDHITDHMQEPAGGAVDQGQQRALRAALLEEAPGL